MITESVHALSNLVAASVTRSKQQDYKERRQQITFGSSASLQPPPSQSGAAGGGPLSLASVVGSLANVGSPPAANASATATSPSVAGAAWAAPGQAHPGAPAPLPALIPSTAKLSSGEDELDTILTDLVTNLAGSKKSSVNALPGLSLDSEAQRAHAVSVSSLVDHGPSAPQFFSAPGGGPAGPRKSLHGQQQGLSQQHGLSQQQGGLLQQQGGLLQQGLPRGYATTTSPSPTAHSDVSDWAPGRSPGSSQPVSSALDNVLNPDPSGPRRWVRPDASAHSQAADHDLPDHDLPGLSHAWEALPGGAQADAIAAAWRTVHDLEPGWTLSAARAPRARLEAAREVFGVPQDVLPGVLQAVGTLGAREGLASPGVSLSKGFLVITVAAQNPVAGFTAREAAVLRAVDDILRNFSHHG